MNLQTAIFNEILQPKYIKIYSYMEEIKESTRISIKNAHRKDIADILCEIILIKEKYRIPYKEDLEILQKYKR
jgi:hypothetical protein